ncbi:MAG TPA: T9SS type A sorting domain-containing protein [Bacteroidetes bacterium]|nr:T9SS type A sorting domain-containing protein [Bacteroidota bacterium]
MRKKGTASHFTNENFQLHLAESQPFMKNMSMNITAKTRRVFVAAFLAFFLASGTQAQISGPTEVCTGATVTYSIPDDPCYILVSWNPPTPFGEIIGPSEGTTVTVHWLQAVAPVELCVIAEVELSCGPGPIELCSFVNVEDLPVTNITENLCIGGCTEIAGEQVCDPGVYTFNLTSYQGCDSTVVATVLPIDPPAIDLGSISLPPGGEYEICGQVFSAPGFHEIYCSESGVCDTLFLFELVFPQVTAEAGPPATVDCSGTSVSLDGTGSSVGANISYQWEAGNCCITGGANTLSPMVNQQGWYFLTVTDEGTGATATDSVYVFGLEAGVNPAVLTCTEPEIELQAVVTGGNAAAYSAQWSTTDGHIVAGANTLNPVIDAAGTYCLSVVSSGQYCSDEDCLTVELDQSDCSVVKGFVLVDANGNCQTDAGEMPLSGWLVTATGANGTFVATTDNNGFYSITVEPGDYTVSLSAASNTYGICTNDVAVSLAGTPAVAAVDFSVFNGLPCPSLTIDISNNILRRCADNNFFYVKYCNEGTVSAEGAHVEITLDPDLTFVYSSIGATPLGGQVFSVEIGDLDPDECGEFWFKAFLACDVEIAETHCTEAHIFPDADCAPPHPLWSGASLKVEASCTDSSRFTITNVGTAALSVPADFVVIEDAVMYRPGRVEQLLQPNESMLISLPANGSTWRLELEQEPFHPFPNVPVAWVEGCGNNAGGTFSTGFVNQRFLGDPEMFIDTDCTQNQAAFDPNEKQGFPLGYGEEHFVKKRDQIEYLIRFQNTGNDTARQVFILDTLDAKLDLTRLRPGASSHFYEYEIYGRGILKLRFPDINLPDSTTDLAGSQGFVQFIVSPKQNVQPGDVIENRAGIYFDSNAPVITNTTFHTIEKPKVFELQTLEICAGGWFNGQQIEADTMLVEKFEQPAYDSFLYTVLQVLPNVGTVQEASICEGGGYFFAGENLTAAGTYQAGFTASNGCDSTVVLTLEVLENFETELDVQICESGEYDFYGQALTEAGVYQTVVAASNGCENVVTLNLEVSEVHESELDVQICESGTYLFYGQSLSEAGIYQATLPSADGCDSLVTLNLTVLENFETQLAAMVCKGGAFGFQGQMLTEAGTYEALLTAANGCDSLVVLDLEIEEPQSSTATAAICPDSSFEFFGQTLTEGGTYEAVLTSANGCDSLVTLQLSVFENEPTHIEAQICEGSGYVFGDQTLTAPGEYEQILTSANGCDSLVQLNLELSDHLYVEQSAGICEGEEYVFNGSTLTEEGSYEANYISAAGCDSTVVLSLAVWPVFENQQAATICFGEYAELAGQQYFESGIYTASLNSAQGCDSVVVLDLTVLEEAGSAFSAAICEGGTFDFNGEALTETGVYTSVLPSAGGCDSTVVLSLQVEPVFADTILENVIYGAFYNGVQIFADTVFTEILVAENGCDSVVSTIVSPLVNTKENLADAIGLSVFPNPSGGHFYLQYYLQKSQNINVKILDLIGQKVVFASQINKPAAGKQLLKINSRNWTPGVYLVRIQMDSGVATGKVVAGQ